MAMIRCPICGEKYSDTYRDCPFCEEEEALQQGEHIRRSAGRSRGGKRATGNRQPSWLSPILIVLIILMAGLLVYLLFGDRIAEKLKGNDSETPSSETVIPQEPTTEGEDPAIDQGGEMPEDPTVEQPTEKPGDALDYAEAAKLPAGLTISTTDFSLMNPGETHTITVSGGSGNYTWISEDDGIASVDENGKVIAISTGTTQVLVTDGSKQATCIVRIKLPAGTTATTPGDNGSGGAHKLSREDFTLPKGESWQLTLSGVTTAVTWATSDAGVATVSGNGTVTAVGKGNATITASWDGQSRTCIVRVS